MKTSLITHSRLLRCSFFLFCKKTTIGIYKKKTKKIAWEKNKKKLFLLIRFCSPICIISSDYTKSALVHFQTIDRTFHYYSLVWSSHCWFFVLCNTHCKQIRENNLWAAINRLHFVLLKIVFNILVF